ncbi:MAG: AAA family ATPase [Patescibacteria group bacterium]|jgi:DNA polymerase-3 subunit delta'
MKACFSGIIGHQAQMEYLCRIIDQKTVAHAYLFSGPAHIGKTLIARCFAAEMLGVDEKSLDYHPNYYFVDFPIDEKTGEPKKHIDIESIREARDRMNLSTFDGGRKILIVNHADTMTIGAQNALLKTLEEPKGDALIILLASMPKILLPTIVSRAVHLRFFPVSTQSILEGLGDEGKKIASLIETYALGRPGIAKSLLDAEEHEIVLEELQSAKDFLASPLAKRFGMIQGLIKKADPAFIMKTIVTWRLELHALLLQELNTPQSEKSAKALLALDEAEESIRRNGNVPLALEYFAIHL